MSSSVHQCHQCSPLCQCNGGIDQEWWTLVNNAEHFGIDPVTRPRTADYIALQGWRFKCVTPEGKTPDRKLTELMSALRNLT